MTTTAHARLRILTVCTANLCRSPVAAELLARHLRARGYQVAVASAGTHGGQSEVHEHTVRAAGDLEIDLIGHKSRLVTSQLVATDGANLVITMTRQHLRHVIGLAPDAWPRTFTLKELARRSVDLPFGLADFAAWRAAAADGRRAADLMSASPLDDLDDPYGGPIGDHRTMVAEVDALCRQIAQFVPAAPETSPNT